MMFSGAKLMRMGMIWCSFLRCVPRALASMIEVRAGPAPEPAANNKLLMELIFEGVDLGAQGKKRVKALIDELLKFCPGPDFTNRF